MRVFIKMSLTLSLVFLCIFYFSPFAIAYIDVSTDGRGTYRDFPVMDSYDRAAIVPSANRTLLQIKDVKSYDLQDWYSGQYDYGLYGYDKALGCMAIYADSGISYRMICNDLSVSFGIWDVASFGPEDNLFLQSANGEVVKYKCYLVVESRYSSENKAYYFVNSNRQICSYYKSGLACVSEAPDDSNVRYIAFFTLEEKEYAPDINTFYFPCDHNVFYPTTRTTLGLGEYEPIDVPDDRDGIFTIPFNAIGIKIPVLFPASNAVSDWQRVIDMDDCALFASDVLNNCYSIMDHYGSSYSKNYIRHPVEIYEHSWDLSKIQVGYNAYLTLSDGTIKAYRCYLVARTDYIGYHLIRGSQLLPKNSDSILCSCCVYTNADEHYICLFEPILDANVPSQN